MINKYFFNLKMKLQRFKKGYCDEDVWNINAFIENKLLALFKEYKKRERFGHPCGTTPEEWEKVIDRIIFLLTEMDEDTCSIQVDINSKDFRNVFLKQSEYRNKCKDELYDLLKQWHWNLWD